MPYLKLANEVHRFYVVGDGEDGVDRALESSIGVGFYPR